jgi:hypothetical protein
LLASFSFSTRIGLKVKILHFSQNQGEWSTRFDQGDAHDSKNHNGDLYWLGSFAVVGIAGRNCKRANSDADLRSLALLQRRVQLGFGSEYDHV